MINPPEPITLTITLGTDSRISVNGPIDNNLLCYGLLELAKVAIQERTRQADQQRIIPASMLPFVPKSS